MASLITTVQLDARIADTPSAEALIEDASALVRQIAAPKEVPDPVPAVIVPVVVAMVRRALENPRGLSGETLGDHQWQASGQPGVYANRDEVRIIRKAVGRLGAGSVQLEGDLLSYVDDGLVL